jgi:hypothetical protein
VSQLWLEFTRLATFKNNITTVQEFYDWIKFKVEEKREHFSLRKLRKPGEREREKYFAPVFEISHTKREKTSL